MSLEQQHPEAAREFHKGNCCSQVQKGVLCYIAIDQAHEQNSAVIKGDEGQLG